MNHIHSLLDYKWFFSKICKCREYSLLQMEPINFFLCVAMFLTAKVDLGNCRFCPVSVKTAREVPSCPTEKSSVLEASKKLKCDELALTQNCTSASRFKYHCVMNVYKNATMEVCAPEYYISGYCAEFNKEGGRIQPHYTVKCIGCPARYVSSDAFKYTYCYKMVRNNQEKKGVMSTTARGTSTSGTSSDIIITSKSREWLTWIIVAIVLVVLLGIVFCIIFFRKRNARARSPNTNQEEQDNPLLETSKTFGIEITEDDAEQRRKDLESKRKTTLQYLGLLLKRELDKLKTGIDTARNTSTLIEAEVCNDNEDIENLEEQLEDLQSKQELKSVEVIKSIDEYTDLFSLLASLYKNRWKSAKQVLSHMISFEKKHRQYFKLFKMEKYSEETLSSDFNNSMRILKNNQEGPTLREIYAASEMLNRKIRLIKYIAGNKRAILISPIILGVPDESKPIELEIKLPFAEKPRFRCLDLAQKGIETVSEELHVINAGHDFCFDKRFRNSFDLLHGENYFCLYIAAQPNKIPTIFEIMGTLIYGESSKECDSADIIKKCLKEHHSGKDMKKVYSKFVDVQLYLSDTEMEKYDRSNGKDKEEMQQKALEKHLQEWKSITQGDFFALSSIFGIILYMKENEKEDQTTQIIHPLFSGIAQKFKGSFILRRRFESDFEVGDSMTKSMSCVCELKTPKVRGKLTSVESVIRELIRKEMSSSKKVCCKARGGRKTHTHLYALQKPDCCLFKRKVSKHNKKKPSENFPLSLRVEERVFADILKENFRKIQETGGSLENALSEEIYGLENNHFIAKLRKKMKSAGEDMSLKIQKATDFVGVPIYVYKMSENYCRWIKFQPRRKRLPVKCRFYITLLLQIAGDRFYRIIPIDGCNCTLDPPETASYLDKDNLEQDELNIPKDKRHNHLIKFLNTVHEKLLSELFVDEARDSPIFPTVSDESEADLILTNSYMSNRSIDPILDASNSLCRCTSKDIFGTEKHFALIENLINQEAVSRDYNSQEHSSNETQADEVTVKTPPNFPADRLHILATIFDCSIYIIRKHTENQDQFSVWEEFKPYSRKYVNSTQSREKCNENFYFTFFYSTEGHFHRVIGINKKDICNCLMDRPKTLRKESMMTKKDRKLKTSNRKLKHIKKNDRHPFKIAIPLDDFIEDEVRHVPLFSCALEISLLSNQNMAARMIDPISDISFSLCRCLSKDVFGTEAHFELVRSLLLHEIELNRSSYDDLIDNELKVVTKDVEVPKDQDPLLLCLSLITDGIQMPTLQLQAAADIFQCSIYVIEIIDDCGNHFSFWEEILPRKQKANETLEGIQCKRTYYITLYRSFTGVFHRVVPKESICNCSLDPPKTSVKEEIQSDKSKISLKAEQQLLKTKAILDEWLRCNTVFELLLISIIDEIEDRRKSVNIATITGSSIGVVGAVLTGIGIIGAPATAGIFLGLTIAGGVISAAGAIASVGAKITEMGLSRKNSKTISRYKIQMDIFSKQLEDNFNKLRENVDPDKKNPEILQAAAPCFRALCAAGSVPFVVFRVLSRAVLEAEAVFVPLSLVIDVALGILAAKNLSEGSVTSESIKLRTSKHHLRLTRQQMLAWAFGNSEEFEKEEVEMQAGLISQDPNSDHV